MPQGWDYYAELAKNGAQAAGGNGDVLKAVSGGDKLYGMIVDYMPIREKAKGAPVEFVFPKEGVSAVTEPVAILSTAKNPEAAKAFVDFLLSEEGQKVAVKQGYIPARADAGLPAGYPDRSAIKVLTTTPPRHLPTTRPTRKNSAKSWASRATLAVTQSISGKHKARIRRSAACGRRSGGDSRATSRSP